MNKWVATITIVCSCVATKAAVQGDAVPSQACRSAPAANPSPSSAVGAACNDPHNAEIQPAPFARHELRVGFGADTFNYASTASSETLSLRTRWSNGWSTEESATSYQRFGEIAELGSLNITRHFGQANWLTFGGGIGPRQAVAPNQLSNLEYGHAMALHTVIVRGLESYVQQRNYWYSNTDVAVIGTTQIVYLPRDWVWTISIAGVRTAAAATEPDWTASGFTRLTFPQFARLRPNVLFAVGAESFLNVDQIGHFSARTFGGGLRYQINHSQDISFNGAVQYRSQGRSQTSAGASYGVRF